MKKTSYRSLFLLSFLLPLTSCDLRMNGHQIYESYNLEFAATSVCDVKESSIEFTNDSGKDVVLKGASIGTNPGQNFVLKGIRIGDTFKASEARRLYENTIPAGETYAFIVTYEPQEYDPDHLVQSATLDAVYAEPQGVIQVELQGTADSPLEGCFDVAGEEEEEENPGNNPGNNPENNPGDNPADDVTKMVQIHRIVLMTNVLVAAITTDDLAPGYDFSDNEPSIPIIFNGNTSKLPKIPQSPGLVLPPTGVTQLIGKVVGSTVVFSTADANGSYTPDKGRITLNDVPISLVSGVGTDQYFAADFPVKLTTGAVDLKGGGSSAIFSYKNNFLGDAGFTKGGNDTTVVGSPIDANTGDVTLVGLSEFEYVDGSPAGVVADFIDGSHVKGLVMIQGTVKAAP